MTINWLTFGIIGVDGGSQHAAQLPGRLPPVNPLSVETSALRRGRVMPRLVATPLTIKQSTKYGDGMWLALIPVV